MNKLMFYCKQNGMVPIKTPRQHRMYICNANDVFCGLLPSSEELYVPCLITAG